MAIQMLTGARIERNLNGQDEFYGLFPEEEEKTNFVLSDNLSARLSRGISALGDSRELKIRILTHTVKGALLGAVVGGGVGALVGIPGGPPGMIAGAGVGALIGGVAGAAGGAVYSVITIPHTQEYKNWKKNEIDKVRDIWDNFIQDNLHILPVCPITQNIISYPVKAADGITYEATDIINWIQRVELQAQAAPPANRAAILQGTSPLKICQITTDTLEYDMSYHPNLFDSLRQVYNSEVDNRVNVVFAQFQQHVQTTRVQMHTQVTMALVNSLQGGQITQQQYDDLSKENSRKLIIPKKIL